MSDPNWLPDTAEERTSDVVLTCEHCGDEHEGRILIFTDLVDDVHSQWVCPGCHADNDVTMTIADYQEAVS